MPIVKSEVILPLVKLINKKKSLYIDVLNKKNPALDKKDLASIAEAAKMPNKNKDTKISDVSYILSNSKYMTFSWSRSEIQSIQNKLKLIELNDGKKRQKAEPVDKKNAMAYIANELIKQNNNYF